MKIITILILAALIFLSSTSEAKTEKIYEKFMCNSSYETDIVSNISLTIFYDFESQEIDAHELINLLKTANKDNPGFEFTECANNFLRAIQNRSINNFVKNKIREIVLNYSKKSLSEGRVSAFSPYAISKSYFDNKETYYQNINSTIFSIQNFCEENVQNYANDSNFFIDQNFINEVIKIAPTLNQTCRNKISNIFANSISKTLPEHFSCTNQNTFCNKRLARAIGLISVLAEVGLAPYSDKIKLSTSTLNLHVILETYTDNNLFNLQNCKTNQAENSVIDIKRENYLSAIYKLRRLENKTSETGKSVKNFEITLPIRFDLKHNNNEWINKTQKCFDLYKEKFRGPNGEFLQFKIETHEETNNIVDIIDNDNFYRSSAEYWWNKASCGTIIHESLHLMGLVDEYNEPKSKFLIDKKYDCRAIGPSDSIMVDHELALNNKFSILYPAQFRMLTEPNCSTNYFYYKCAKDSDKTSKANLGNGCSVSRPQICSTINWLM